MFNEDVLLSPEWHPIRGQDPLSGTPCVPIEGIKWGQAHGMLTELSLSRTKTVELGRNRDGRGDRYTRGPQE